MPLGPQIPEGVRRKKAKHKQKPIFYVPNAGGAFGIYSINKHDRRQVRQVQSVLRNLGIYKGAIDGIWGPKTERGWRIYRQPSKSGQYGSIGTQVQNEKLLAKFHQQQAREVERRYRELQANLGRLRRSGDVDALTHAAITAQFWAGTGTVAGGAFAKAAKQAKEQLKFINKAKEESANAKREAEAAAKRANNSFLAKAGRAIGKVGDVLQPYTGIKTGVSAGLKAVEWGTEQVQRPIYATQLLENQRIARGEQSFTESPGIEWSDIGQAVVGTFGGRSLISPRVKAALEATDTYDEREALRRAGMLESFGERTSRDLYAQIMSRWGDPETKAALRSARSFKEATPGFDPKGLFSSRVVDIGLQAVDPLNVAPAWKAASFLDDVAKATKFIEKNPGLTESLTARIADIAEKAAARDPGTGIGDVRLLQQAVPSLKTARGKTTELAAALVSTEPDNALRYLDDLAANFPTGETKRLVDEATVLVKQEGMSKKARQAILKASMGRTWKPRVSFKARAAAGVLGKVDTGLTDRAMAAMPTLTRQAKLTSLTDLLGNAVKGKKTSYIGRYVEYPNEGPLIRFADRTAAERGAARAYLKALSKNTAPVTVEMAGISRNINKLPDSPLKRIMTERFTEVDAKLGAFVDEQLASFSEYERRALAWNHAQFQREINEAMARVTELKKQLKRALTLPAPSGEAIKTKLARAQDRLRSLEKVEEVREGRVRQPALMKELKTLRKEAAEFSKLKPITYEQAVYNFNSEMRDYAYMIGKHADPRVSPWTKAVRAISRTFNDVPLSVVNLHEVNDRAKAFRDYALALGASKADADSVYARMARTMPSHEALKEAEKISDGLLKNFFRFEGFDADQIKEALAHIEQNRKSFWRETEGWFSMVDQRSQKFKSKFDRTYDVEGATSPVVNSQLQYNWHAIDPNDLRAYVNKVRRHEGSVWAHVNAYGSAFAYGFAQGYQPLHRTFKFLALTLAAPRYILRVAAMEERLRMWMTHGFTSAFEVNAKYVRRLNWKTLDATAGARFFSGQREVGIEGIGLHLLDKLLIQVTGHGLINQGEKGFVENLWHVLTFQVQPEMDELHHLLMPHLYGDEAALAAAKESAVEMLETTRLGRAYLDKARIVNSEYRDSSKLVDKVEEWLKEVMPNQSIVDKRLNGQFSLSELKKNPEWHPEKIWGDKYESLLRPRNPISWVHDVAGRLTMQSPTVSLNRQPFAWAEFNREYDSLIASGATAEAAKEMAGSYAVKRTNEILFDSSVRSRFAQKFDILFPFQQAREEVVRVWAKLVRENPARAAKTLDLMATAFNAGENNGIVTKDQYGQWQLTVPGSPALSRALGRWAPDWVPFKDGLTKLAGSRYTFQLRSLLFVQDVWGTVPRPGGPWWTVVGNTAVQAHPEWFPKNSFWQKYLFDERNPTTLWLRPEVARLYIAATGKTFVPWEPFGSFGIGGHEAATERIRDRMVGEVGAELYRQWIASGANPKEKPTAEDVANAVRAQLFTWGLVGMVVPASTRVTVPGREDFEDIKAQFTVNGTLDIGALLRNHPEMVGFVAAHTKDVIRDAYTNEDGTVDIERLKSDHPEYWARWKQRGSPQEEGPEAIIDQLYSARDYLSPEEWVERIDQSRRTSQAWHDYHAILNSGVNFAERERSLSAWKKQYGDLDEAWGKRVNDHARDLEFDRIMSYPPAAREVALRDWRYRWDVSAKTEQELRQDAGRGISHRDPWIDARNSADLVAEWQKNDEGLSAVSWAKKHATVHEQLGFINYMLNYADDVQDWNDLWRARGELMAKHYDELFGNKSSQRLEETTKASEDYWSQKKHDASQTIGKKYDQLAHISEQQNALAKRAQAAHGAEAHALWVQVFALKDKKNRLYAEIRGIQNSLYHHFADLKGAADEVKLMRLVDSHGKGVLDDLDKYGIPYLEDSQERKWNQMPERIKQDYVDDLMERLTTKPGEFRTKRGESSLKWSYLTEFQKDVLKAKLNERQLDTLHRMSDAREDAENGFKGRRSGRWKIWGHTLGNGFGELTFALEQFKKYNKRGNMPEPKQELAEYRRLGDNAILKSQYLKDHPRLQQWFRLGPMSNMPPVVAEIVHNVMVKYGKWDDEDGAMSWNDIAELGFAKTILEKYNKRTGSAPAAYELWVKMPTGKARFKYMQQHPEIERWLQNGPMAQMPDAYKEVVRDIMERYGLWSEKTDPLSVLISQYHATPSYAKQKFLEEHPEILAYWRAIRSGRDRVLFDLAQNYFAMQDEQGKKAFLEAHPELLEYFVQQRQERYESFLNQVARYLGQTPELAELYLSEQTKYLHQMIDAFGQRPLVASTVTRVSYGGPRRVERQGQRERST